MQAITHLDLLAAEARLDELLEMQAIMHLDLLAAEARLDELLEMQAIKHLDLLAAEARLDELQPRCGRPARHRHAQQLRLRLPDPSASLPGRAGTDRAGRAGRRWLRKSMGGCGCRLC